ncbi:hypothetical protein GS682_29705 [Nostoc sp. B(2019)]|nr:hypothetical protein [Nostoc sp. B(2019)]
MVYRERHYCPLGAGQSFWLFARTQTLLPTVPTAPKGCFFDSQRYFVPIVCVAFSVDGHCLQYKQSRWVVLLTLPIFESSDNSQSDRLLFIVLRGNMPVGAIAPPHNPKPC